MGRAKAAGVPPKANVGAEAMLSSTSCLLSRGSGVRISPGAPSFQIITKFGILVFSLVAIDSVKFGKASAVKMCGSSGLP
jgi:hypothetical protein